MVYCNGFLSDWETYFEEVHRFISSLGGGRMSFANELYTEFVLERLGNCVRSLTTLLEYVQPVYALDMYNSEYEIISAYHQQLSELLSSIRDISIEWQAHFDHMSSRSETSFQLEHDRPGNQACSW